MTEKDSEFLIELPIVIGLGNEVLTIDLKNDFIKIQCKRQIKKGLSDTRATFISPELWNMMIHRLGGLTESGIPPSTIAKVCLAIPSWVSDTRSVKFYTATCTKKGLRIHIIHEEISDGELLLESLIEYLMENCDGLFEDDLQSLFWFSTMDGFEEVESSGSTIIENEENLSIGFTKENVIQGIAEFMLVVDIDLDDYKKYPVLSYIRKAFHEHYQNPEIYEEIMREAEKLKEAMENE